MKSTFAYSSSGHSSGHSLSSASSNQAYWPLGSDNFSNKGSARTAKPKSLRTQLSNLFGKMAMQLTTSSDPFIWQTRNPAGQTVWNAKDERSGRVICGASESEMRVWLEERYRF
ncbi:MAG: hypothetical protein WBA76_08460 [Phormidesmis sp.]